LNSVTKRSWWHRLRIQRRLLCFDSVAVPTIKFEFLLRYRLTVGKAVSAAQIVAVDITRPQGRAFGPYQGAPNERRHLAPGAPWLVARCHNFPAVQIVSLDVATPPADVLSPSNRTERGKAFSARGAVARRHNFCSRANCVSRCSNTGGADALNPSKSHRAGEGIRRSGRPGSSPVATILFVRRPLSIGTRSTNQPPR
jgi:hypothetical protein